MTTLEDAAEQLVVKLKGLDSEVEESREHLQKLMGRIERISDEVEEEWSHLIDAVRAFEGGIRTEDDTLGAAAAHTGQALEEARQALAQDTAEVRSEAAEGQGAVDALGRHTAELETRVEPLVSDSGEAPAKSLTERAEALSDSLATVLREAAEWLEQEAGGLEDAAEDARARCADLCEDMADGAVDRLNAVCDAWEGKVDELEAHVEAQGFVASRSHARAVVDWAMDECRRVCEEELNGFDERVAGAVRPLEEFARQADETADALAETAADLATRLREAHQAGAGAVAALEATTALLGRYSFVGA